MVAFLVEVQRGNVGVAELQDASVDAGYSGNGHRDARLEAQLPPDSPLLK